MNRVIVNISVDLTKIPNLQELLPKEQAVVAKWKEDGIQEHLFLNGTKGAILVFKDIDENKAKELIPLLPLVQYADNVVYLSVEKYY
ncbi:MAG: hypothetical protein Q4G16_09455 [Cruoricaptor ignavus]|nr:hypothetical protein [Cruoricaptor ignavus]